MELNSVTETERNLLEAGRDANAAMAQMFDLVADLDEAEAHDAYSSASAWLTFHLGLTGRTARLWVRSARALRLFPLLRDAFAGGLISFDQLTLLLRIAAPDNQEFLLQLAQSAGGADDLRKRVRDLEEQDEEPEEDPDPTPHLFTRWHNDRLFLKGDIPGADGILIDQALRRLAAQAPRDEVTGLFRDPGVRNAEALVQMSSEALAADGSHDRATIVVQMSAEDIVAEDGPGWDAATRIFSKEELRRIACDARLQPTLRDRDRVTVGVGRTTRKIEPWLRRVLEGRDRGCRFPGCDRTRWLHGHHLIPWSEGGTTNLDNLVLLCGYHHRLIHRRRWTIKGDPNHELRFYTGLGLLHTPARDRFPPRWHEHLAESADRLAERRRAELANAPP